MNKLFSAMPSSTCWPASVCDQTWAEGMRRALKTSSTRRRWKTPRRFTKPPRPVETVTSGEVVTTRRPKSVSSLAISNITLPKAAWVDCSAAPRTAPRKTSALGVFTPGAV
jgi:hypothetical protein